MRILYYTDAPHWGGAERALETLLAALPRNVTVSLVGLDAAVCARLSVAAADRLSAVHVLRIGRFRGDPKLICRIWRTIRSERPDVVHINMTWPFSSLEALLALAVSCGPRVVAHEHMPLRMRTPVHGLVKRVLSRRVDEHVVVEEAGAALLAAGAGLPRSKLRVITNGIVSASRIRPDRARVDARPTVLGIGRFTAQKGFDVLIDAVAGLPDVCLLLVGARTEDEATAVRGRAVAAGMADRLHIVPWTDDPRTWLAAADLLAVSSRFESGPLTLLEALAAELPVVSTDVGYAREVLGRLDVRLVVPVEDSTRLRDAIAFVLGRQDESYEFARRGRAIVESDFTAEAMAVKFVALYSGTLE